MAGGMACRTTAGPRRAARGVDGPAALHAVLTEQLAEDAGPSQVVVGIETDRRLWVQALIAAGYTVTRYDEHDTVFGVVVVPDPDLATGSADAPQPERREPTWSEMC